MPVRQGKFVVYTPFKQFGSVTDETRVGSGKGFPICGYKSIDKPTAPIRLLGRGGILGAT
ncbi:hypothetical protein MFFC18_41040 [Mariniblastus fucicola]|uniref:Uncharacterized protein n=1 Tax=Mariniblastus fucicola TaxID=980251 RepID=A0A5B9PBT2_9BACT|nr:hypothetical protein MFFC18_41040 [Mariniblastus fucicola]